MGGLVVATVRVPKATDGGVSVTAGLATAMMEIVSDCIPVPPALVALIVTVPTPAAVGMPEIRPVAVLIMMPSGRELTP